MKKLLLIALFLGIPLAKADPHINIINNNHIEYNSKDWQLAAQSNIYDLYVSKKSLNTKERIVAMTSVTEFNDPEGYQFKDIPGVIQKIYTYGIVECPNGLLNLLNSWYVDKHNKIVYTQEHTINTYIVDLRQRNTPRNDLFQLVCPNN